MVETRGLAVENRAAAYFGVRSATTPAWIDRERLAFLSDASGVPQVWATGIVVGADATALTGFRERVGALLGAPGGGRLAFGMDAGGDERQQIWTVPPGPDGKARAVTEDPETIHGFGAVAPDGRRLAFASNARDQRYFDVLTIDLGDPRASAETVLAADELLTPIGWSPDGRSLLVRRANTNLDHDLLLVPVSGEAPALLTPHSGEATVAAAAFDPRGGGVYVATNQDRDVSALVRIDLGSLAVAEVAAGEWDVEGLAVTPEGDALAYSTNEDGASRVVIREVASGSERALSGLPPGVVEGMVWSPDGSRLAFAWSGPRHPSDVWVAGRDGVARRVTDSDLAGLNRDEFGEPATVRYRSFDGLEIPAFWYPPRVSGARPVVIEVHGGPESQRRIGFSPLTQLLLAEGYGVLAPNVRGSTGYGKAYCHLDDVEKRPDAVADLAAAAGWLRQRPEVAGAKIAVMGGSYGGFMTLATLTTDPDLWAAGVDIVGIADFATFLERTGPWRRATRAAEYGDPERDAALLRDISPLHKADRIRAPLLVIHGRNDPRVPLYEAEQIVETLRGLGRPVELLVFDDEGHGLVKRENRIAGYGAAAAFLAEVLTVT